MKNQYVGDINDYYKYGLLRILSGFGKKKIGVCWMLTPDDDSQAGGLTGYLNNRDKWRDYDPDVFDALHKIVFEDRDRRVKRIEEAGILPSACFFRNNFPEDSKQRENYFGKMLRKFAGVDVIFFDPDVGLVPPKSASRSKRHNKWLYFDELDNAFKGRSTLVIQFYKVRKSDFVRRKLQQIWETTRCAEIHSFQAGNVEFFLAAERKHADFFRHQSSRVKERWGNQITVTPYRCGDKGLLQETTEIKDAKSGTTSAAKSVYSVAPVKLDRVRTYPLGKRPSKVSVADFARVPPAGASVAEWTKALPKILAGNDFRAVVEALERARRKRKPIIWGLGGHVIKVGLGPILINLLERGYVTAVAMNGAAPIHDFEIALVGATSEDVPTVLGRGKFGMAEETGRFISEAITAGEKEDLGVGEAVGRFLARSRHAKFRRFSLLAAAYQNRVPVTVHEAIGTDIIHMHPATDARALGASTHRDFRLLAAIVRTMNSGGVYLNVGSAVVLPEVFLKCVSLAANLSRAPRGITTVNLDFIQHYRPTQNVLIRPTAAGGKGRNPSRGYALTGHHELMIPLLAAALSARGRARR